MSCEVFPHRADDGAYAEVAGLARASLEGLADGFVAPLALLDERQEDRPYEHVTRTRRFGTPSRGLLVTVRDEYVEMGVVTTNASRHVVEAYGLPQGWSLRLESVRPPNVPSFLRRLEARVEGPAELVTRVTEGARALRSPPVGEEIDKVLACARHHLRPYGWTAAARYASLALEVRPGDVDARFVLGVALGANGDFGAALEHLRFVVERRPDDYDAWYNFGLGLLETKDLRGALACFEAALRASPDNHALLFQLGVTRDALGDRHGALDAYRRAISHSPNPGGAWGYRGKDFTEEARQAVERLAGGGGRPGERT